MTVVELYCEVNRFFDSFSLISAGPLAGDEMLEYWESKSVLEVLLDTTSLETCSFIWLSSGAEVVVTGVVGWLMLVSLFVRLLFSPGDRLAKKSKWSDSMEEVKEVFRELLCGV